MEDYRSGRRVWELDFLRGMALILMIYFHIIFDMRDIYGYGVDYNGGVNGFIGTVSAVAFIIVSGISCSLSRNNFKRGVKLLVLAMLITLATEFYSPMLGVKFGILHFLGICIMLSPVFSRLNKYLNLWVGTAIILMGFFTARITVPNDYLFIFGLYSPKFISSDYYPLIPWLGIFLYGLAAGKELYSRKKSIFRFPPGDNIINAAGRHTLLYYLVHQPVIIGVLALVSLLKGST